MIENSLVVVPFGGHHGSPYLTQPYAMAPTGTFQNPSGRNMAVTFIFRLGNKCGAVKMCA